MRPVNEGHVWTLDEEEALLQLGKVQGSEWKDIAKDPNLIRRTGQNCKDKWVTFLRQNKVQESDRLIPEQHREHKKAVKEEAESEKKALKEKAAGARKAAVSQDAGHNKKRPRDPPPRNDAPYYPGLLFGSAASGNKARSIEECRFAVLRCVQAVTSLENGATNEGQASKDLDVLAGNARDKACKI